MNTKKNIIVIIVSIIVLLGFLVWTFLFLSKNPKKDTPAVVDITPTGSSVSVSDSSLTIDTDEIEPVSGTSIVINKEKSKKKKPKTTPAATTKPGKAKTSSDKKTVSQKSSTKKQKTAIQSSKKKKESSNKTSMPNKKQENSTQTSTDNKKEEEKIYTTNLSNLAISSKDAACEVSGKIVKISHAGSYTLSGSSSDAQILVDAPKTESVTLICNGISIKNSNSSALYIKSADKVTLELSGNTKNTITDGTSYSLSSGATEPNSAIFSQEDLIIKGNGSLYVTANYQDGIATKNDLKIQSGTLTVNAKDDGLRGKDGIHISGGNVSVTAEAHGLKTTETTAEAKGNVKISGGKTTIHATKDGIHATRNITVSGGTISIDAKNEGIDTDTTFTITGGTCVIDGPKSTNHASLTCEKGYYLNGGTFLALGSSSLIKAPASDSKNKFIFYKYAAQQADETKVQIKTSGGKSLFDHVAARKFQNIIFSSPNLSSGNYGIFSNSVRVANYTLD